MLRQYKRLPEVYKDCEVVEFVLSKVKSFDVDQFNKGE